MIDIINDKEIEWIYEYYGENYNNIYNFDLLKKIIYLFPIISIILIFLIRRNKFKNKIIFYFTYIFTLIINVIFYFHLLLICNSYLGKSNVNNIHYTYIILLILTFIIILLEILFNRKGKHNEHN